MKPKVKFMIERARVLATVAAASMGLCSPVHATDPKVPPGQDPGGTAIALIGGGLDYTSDKITPRVARDGEGELIGWDLIDNDRTPYMAAPKASDPSASPDAKAASADATGLAELMLAAYARGRLVPVRSPAGDAQALAKSIAFVADTPARIVAIAMPLDSAALRAVVRQASERFKDHVFIVAGAPGGDSTGKPSEAASMTVMNLGNVLVVAALEDVKGKSVDDLIKATDMLVRPRGGSMFAGIVAGGPPRNGLEAVVLAAAAVACQGHGRDTPLLGSAAKAATLDAARPLADAPAVRVLDPMCWYGGVRY
jgi:hypothetical protein